MATYIHIYIIINASQIYYPLKEKQSRNTILRWLCKETGYFSSKSVINLMFLFELVTVLLNTESNLLSFLELMWWENSGHCDTAGPALGVLWTWHFTPHWPSLSNASAGQSRKFLPSFLYHLLKHFLFFFFFFGRLLQSISSSTGGT